MQKSSIKELAARLKNQDPPQENKSGGKESTTEKKSGKRVDNFKTKNLEAMIERINAMDHFKISEIIHIDQDIHQVCKKIKDKTRLKISHLVSFLLEQFIRENLEEIKQITAEEQKNRYLE